MLDVFWVQEYKAGESVLNITRMRKPNVARIICGAGWENLGWYNVCGQVVHSYIHRSSQFFARRTVLVVWETNGNVQVFQRFEYIRDAKRLGGCVQKCCRNEQNVKSMVQKGFCCGSHYCCCRNSGMTTPRRIRLSVVEALFSPCIMLLLTTAQKQQQNYFFRSCMQTNSPG